MPTQYDRAIKYARQSKSRPDPAAIMKRVEHDSNPGQALAFSNYGLILMAEGEVPIPPEWNVEPSAVQLNSVDGIAGSPDEAEYHSTLWYLLRRVEQLSALRRLQLTPGATGKFTEDLVQEMIGNAAGFRDTWNAFLAERPN